jgi:DNA invertase Pin-like site-specific DNA recombinase
MTTNDDTTVEYSRRRQRSLKRTRLMDAEKSVNADTLPPHTPVVIYVRVSSEEQVEGYSLSAQERFCREFAEKRHWDVVKVYSDPGHSGKNDRRPDFQNMITDAARHKFKAILFHKLDRFSRNIENTMKYIKDLNGYDVTLASVTEEFDFTTAQGRLFFRLMSLFAQWYLENLSSEVVKGKMEMARRGVHNGRLPFGYIKKKDGKVVVVKSEANIIRKAFELYATGEYTDQTIAEFLNKNEYKTRRGRNWSKDTITDFLKNEFYYGKVAYRDQLWPGRHEPVIDKDLFDKCMEVRSSHATRPRTHISQPKIKHPNLLQRIICCNHCGRLLRIQSVHNYKGTLYGYYQEASRLRGFNCEYASKVVRMNEVEDQVFAFLTHIRLPKDWQAEIERLVQNMDTVRQIENRRAQIDEELRRVGRAYADGVYTEDEYDQRRIKLIAEKDSLVVPDGARVIEIGLRLESLDFFLQEATDDEKYQILHLLFDYLYFDFEKSKIVRFKPKAEFAHIFRLAAPLMGWHVSQENIFDLAQEIVDTPK